MNLSLSLSRADGADRAVRYEGTESIIHGMSVATGIDEAEHDASRQELELELKLEVELGLGGADKVPHRVAI